MVTGDHPATALAIARELEKVIFLLISTAAPRPARYSGTIRCAIPCFYSVRLLLN